MPDGDRIFVVGRDRRGRWVVRDTAGLYGGCFASRRAALSYARFESCGKRDAVRETNATLDVFRSLGG
ncbi:hypothetical protein ACTZWW_19390 [Salinarimonas sp. NSM]